MIRRCTAADFDTILAIINQAAQKYQSAIPPDCWHEPYMTELALNSEIASGVNFWGWDEEGALLGIMGIQSVRDVTLIRHAYVAPSCQGKGIGGALLAYLANQATSSLLVGTWGAAAWAINFYQRHGFRLVAAEEERDRLLSTYWSISPRQKETSVVLVYAH